ncbi:hypothetical protein PRIC1_014654 [Phytophthora ramorum]|nr:hypothetical protein KRP23_11850 [Phytophthora ramorum]KAH7496175.1 hypothetical protein KRP22_14069 [Phytophthora ramorum]
MYISILVALAMVVVTACVIFHQWRAAQRNVAKVKEQEQAIEHLRELKHVASMGFIGEVDASKTEKGTPVLSLSEVSVAKSNRKEDYSTNFV